jgi:hypothetical protein
MNWLKQGSVTKIFPQGIGEYGPFNLPVNFPYTGIQIIVDDTEDLPIHCVIQIEISYDAGTTWELFLNYTWDFGALPGRDGAIGRNFSCTWDLPEIFRGTKVKVFIDMNRAARFTIDFNSGDSV